MADNEFDDLDFFPDLSEESKPEKITLNNEPKTEIIPPEATVVQNSNKAVTISHLVNMTEQHINDDQRVRDEMDELTGILDDSMHQMTIKEMLEYLKLKLREREFHSKCIFDAFNFVQRSELSKEMLVGGDRKERVIQAMDNQKMTKLLGYLNMNNQQDN